MPKYLMLVINAEYLTNAVTKTLGLCSDYNLVDHLMQVEHTDLSSHMLSCPQVQIVLSFNQ